MNSIQKVQKTKVFSGYIDDIRISKKARWNNNFLPPFMEMIETPEGCLEIWNKETVELEWMRK
jgi:hypothetical protein